MAKDNTMLWVLAGGAALWYFSKNGLPGSKPAPAPVPTGNMHLLPPGGTIPVDYNYHIPLGAGGAVPPPPPPHIVSTGALHTTPPHFVTTGGAALPMGSGGTPAPHIVPAPASYSAAPQNPNGGAPIITVPPGNNTGAIFQSPNGTSDQAYQTYLNRDFGAAGAANENQYALEYNHAAMAE